MPPANRGRLHIQILGRKVRVFKYNVKANYLRPQHNPYFSKTLENMPLVLFDKI